MNILVVICGRAGSKGVQNKNIRNFLGKPLIFYTIAAASIFKNENEEELIDICVNSDSEELLKIAGYYEVTCIKRPAELAQDESPKLLSVRQSLAYMEEKNNRRYDYIIDLDITSPLRTSGNILNCLKKLECDERRDVVFSAVPSRRNPYFNMVEKRGEKMSKVMDGSYQARQQAPRVYDMNASIYCYRRSSLMNRLKKSPLDGDFDIILMRDTAVLDIDSEEDFKMMEYLADGYFQNEFQEVLTWKENHKTEKR